VKAAPDFCVGFTRISVEASPDFCENFIRAYPKLKNKESSRTAYRQHEKHGPAASDLPLFEPVSGKISFPYL
jgi:hypothetical protein